MLVFKNKYYAITFLVLALTIFLSIFQAYNWVNLLFIIVSIICIITNSNYIIFLFLVMLPTNGFIPPEFKILGVFHPVQTVGLFALIYLYGISLNEKRKTKAFIKKNKLVTVISSIVLFIYFYYIIVELKQYILFEETTVVKLVTRVLKYTIAIIPLYLIVKLSVIKDLRLLLFHSIIFVSVMLSLSIIFSAQLTEVGIVSSILVQNFSDEGAEVIRNAGVFTDFGGTNSAGGYLTICFALLLSILFVKNNNFFKQEREIINKYLLSLITILTFFGILVTVSKAALFSVAAICILIFLDKGITIKKVIIALVILVIVFLGFNFISQNLIYRNYLLRFQELGEGLSTENITTRGGTWKYYLNFFYANPYTFIVGSFEDLWDNKINVFRAAHNFYLQLIFYAGLIPLVYFIQRLRKIISLKSLFYINPLIIIVPFLIDTNSVSEPASVFALIPILTVLIKKNDSL